VKKDRSRSLPDIEKSEKRKGPKAQSSDSSDPPKRISSRGPSDKQTGQRSEKPESYKRVRRRSKSEKGFRAVAPKPPTDMTQSGRRRSFDRPPVSVD